MAKYEEPTLEEQTSKIYSSMCRTLGEYINYIREKNGISLRELYKRTKISIAVLSEIENGQKIPRFETLIKLVLALNIPFNQVFGTKFINSAFVLAPNYTKKNRPDEVLRNALINEGYTKDEIKEIVNFARYTVSKRDIQG